MIDFDKSFSQIQFSEKAEKSLKEFSDWIFGISIGICALLIIQLRTVCEPNKVLYIIIAIVSLINALFSGFNKYLVLNRAVRLDTKYGEMKKMVMITNYKQNATNEEKILFDKVFNEWVAEYNKIKTIGKFVNFSIYIAAITVIISGIYILINLPF